MSNLSKQDKIDIYNSWKYYYESASQLSEKSELTTTNINYLCRLIDRYGLQILDRSYTVYSTEFKQKAINRAFSGQEAILLCKYHWILAYAIKKRLIVGVANTLKMGIMSLIIRKAGRAKIKKSSSSASRSRT